MFRERGTQTARKYIDLAYFSDCEEVWNSITTWFLAGGVFLLGSVVVLGLLAIYGATYIATAYPPALLALEVVAHAISGIVTATFATIAAVFLKYTWHQYSCLKANEPLETI